MNTQINNTIYTDEEIEKVADKMYGEYKTIFYKRSTPTSAILDLGRLLSDRPYTEDKKLISLEYAARIKYEIQQYIDFININVSKDPKYNEYKSDEFAVNQAVNFLYQIDDEEEMKIPKLVRYCIGNALYAICKENNGDNKKLILNNK